jgi:hypothetical protein
MTFTAAWNVGATTGVYWRNRRLWSPGATAERTGVAIFESDEVTPCNGVSESAARTKVLAGSRWTVICCLSHADQFYQIG